MAIAKRQHYVPRFYLAAFASQEPVKSDSIWVYDKHTKAVRLQPINETAVVRNFYSFQTNDAGTNTIIEQMLSDIESKSSPIIAKWIQKGAVPTIEEIGEVARFVTSLYIRVPRHVASIRAMSAIEHIAQVELLSKDRKRLQAAYSHMLQQENFSLSFEDFESLIANFGEKFRVEVDEKYAMASAILQANDLQRSFTDLYWCLCTAAPYSGWFITCDAPINVFSYNGGKALFGAGLGLPNVHVTLPLSPTVCLSLSHTSKWKTRMVGPAFIREINRRMAYQAERYVFATKNSKRIAGLVEEASAATFGVPRINEQEAKEHLKVHLARAHRKGPKSKKR